MDRSPQQLKAEIKRLAAAAGYIRCGILPAEPFAEYAAALDERIRMFPEAAHHYAAMRRRIDPRRTAPWARSIVVCLRRYGKYRLPPQLLGYIGRNYLADRRTPACPEYPMARRMTEGLRALGLRVKKGGVPDRPAAVKAGIAHILRNGFAWTPEAGSWINIESWRVSAELPPDTPNTGCPCPAECRACIDACPTRALSQPFTMRMDHCIAYLTYDAPFPIPPELWKRMGAWIYGCDVCQEVCPLNAGCWEDLEPAPWLERALPYLAPEALAEMDAATYAEIVHPLFWYIPKHDPARWRANARRALALPPQTRSNKKRGAAARPLASNAEWQGNTA